MNKTKKDKYLRKNRRGKNGKNGKHKTRRMQRGGQPDVPTAVHSDINNIGDTSPSSKDPVLIAAKLEKAALEESKNEQKPNDEIPGILGKAKAWLIYKFTPGTKENMEAVEDQKRLEELSKVSSETDANIKDQIEYYNAKNNELLASLKSSIRLLTTLNVTGGSDSDIAALKKKIQELEAEMLENTKKVGELEAALGANRAEAIGAFQDPTMGMGMGMGLMGTGMMDPQHHKYGEPTQKPTGQKTSFFSRTPIDPAAAAAAAETKAAVKASEAETKAQAKAAAEAAKASEAETKAQAKAAAEAAKSARKAQAQALRDEQIQKEEAAGLKRGKGIVGRASDSVKNTVMSLKKTLITNPFNKTPKKTDPENTSESEPLLDDSSRSNDSNDSATQKKSWRESASARLKTAKNALISTKDSLLNRITRKNRGTQNPEGSAIEMQEMKADSSKPTSSANSSQTPQSLTEVATPYNPNIAAPTRAPPPPPTRPSPPLSAEVATPYNPNIAVPTRAPPTRPSPPLSAEVATPPPTADAVSPSPPPPTRPTPPPIAPRRYSSSQAVQAPQDGGNITRKNRQYIHEIKNNRTHLFNKEMEIINSIRNFKHGHGPNEHGKNKPENIQKKFIKVIKRS